MVKRLVQAWYWPASITSHGVDYGVRRYSHRCRVRVQNLPVSPPSGMTVDDFLTHMAVDKKNIDGRLRFVLMKSCDAYGGPGAVCATKRCTKRVLQLVRSATGMYRTSSLAVRWGTIGDYDRRVWPGQKYCHDALF